MGVSVQQSQALGGWMMTTMMMVRGYHETNINQCGNVTMIATITTCQDKHSKQVEALQADLMATQEQARRYENEIKVCWQCACDVKKFIWS